MAHGLPQELSRFVVDKKLIRERVARQNAEMGITSTPALPLEEYRAQLLASGIQPEDNLISCGIVAARNE